MPAPRRWIDSGLVVSRPARWVRAVAARWSCLHNTWSVVRVVRRRLRPLRVGRPDHHKKRPHVGRRTRRVPATGKRIVW